MNGARLSMLSTSSWLIQVAGQSPAAGRGGKQSRAAAHAAWRACRCSCTDAGTAGGRGTGPDRHEAPVPNSTASVSGRYPSAGGGRARCRAWRDCSP